MPRPRLAAPTLLAAVFLTAISSTAQESPEPAQPAWGRITRPTPGTGDLRIEVHQWPADGRLPLPTPFPNITSAHVIDDGQRIPVAWTFNADASQITVIVPTRAPSDHPPVIKLETAEKTGQWVGGRIVLSALDAAVQGRQARLETHPGNHRIGFWTDASDSVQWNYKPTRWGAYDAELTFSADGGEGTVLEFKIGRQSFSVRRPSTGSWYRYQTLPLGRVYLPTQEPIEVRAGASSLKGPAVMNLKAITLRPAPEGSAIHQKVYGDIVLHARDAITHSTLMRYEPQPIKNCLGYWADPRDWAEWEFNVTQPGTFDVEVWQGCGKGHGGSEVAVAVGDQQFTFTVEDTGHFQNFIPRKLGRIPLTVPGPHTLRVVPLRKKAGAVMDIRQVRLVATTPHPAPPLLRSLLDARRVVFLGDSITYAGEWVEFVETWIRLNYPAVHLDFLDLGLPSETVSGLSEPGHAGGSFPRPTLHERLARVLDKTRPDVLVACYGMNDGIYHPYSEERARAFQEGIRKLRERAAATGAVVVHVTPPTFDSVPLKGRTLPAGLAEYRSPFEGYNDVLNQYSNWLLDQRSAGWTVVDAHHPMNRFLAERRKSDPAFNLAGDGVHANTQGHWLIAREFLRQLGADDALLAADQPDALVKRDPRAAEIHGLVQKRHRARKDSWLTHVGHVRPGMAAGKPLDQAEREAEAIEAQLARP